MINKISGPFVILSRTRQTVTSFDELDDDMVILSTEDGKLLSFEDNQGSEGNDMIMKIFDPTGEVLLKYFQTSRNVFADVLRRFDDVQGAPDGLSNKTEIDTDKKFLYEGFEYNELSDEQKKDIGFEDPPDNFLSNTFYVMYGVDNFKNAVPFKKVTVSKFILDQGTDSAYTLTVKFISYPPSDEVVQDEFKKNTRDSVDQRDVTQQQSNAQEGTWNIWPKNDDDSRKFYLYRAKYKKAMSPGLASYISMVPDDIELDNSYNLAPTLEFFFQNYLTDYKKGKTVTSDDFIPMVFLPPALESKILEHMEDYKESNGDPMAKLPIWDAKMQQGIIKKFSNCGIALFKEIESDKSISRWNEPFQVDITINIINPTGPSASRINKCIGILNSLLKEFSVDETYMQACYINDPVHVEEFIKTHCTNEGGIYKDYYLVDRKNGTKESLLSIDLEDNSTQFRPLLIIAGAAFIRGILNVNPNIVERSEQAKIVQFFKEVSNFSSAISEINMKKFFKGDVLGYVHKLVNHYNYVQGEELLGSEFSLNSGMIEKPILKKGLLSLFEFYTLNRNNDDILNIKVKQADTLPLPFVDDIFAFTQKPTVDDLDFMVKSVKASPQDPLTDGKIDYIANTIARQSFENPKTNLAIDELLRDGAGSKFSDAQATTRDLLNRIKSNKNISKSNVSSTSLINYLTYFTRMRDANRKISLKIKPKFRKYQSYSKDDHLIFLRVINPNVPLIDNPLARKSLITNLYQIEHIKHVMGDGECYTQLELFVCPLANYLSNVHDLEEIYARKIFDLANPEI